MWSVGIIALSCKYKAFDFFLSILKQKCTTFSSKVRVKLRVFTMVRISFDLQLFHFPIGLCAQYYCIIGYRKLVFYLFLAISVCLLSSYFTIFCPKIKQFQLKKLAEMTTLYPKCVSRPSNWEGHSVPTNTVFINRESSDTIDVIATTALTLHS